jgi:type II secretory ATPase GspE/PulE/Tfp pilus assembly ATPase PilB-like protein
VLTQVSRNPESEALAVARVPRTLAFRYDVLPLIVEEDVLHVAMCEPENVEALTQLRVVTRLRLNVHTMTREEIRERLRGAYPTADSVRGLERADEAPAVRVVAKLYERAVIEHASDVHVEPTGHGGRVRFRIDGILREVEVVQESLYGAVVSRIKLLAGMDITDRRQPHDGRYTVTINQREIDARVSSIPTINGEKVVVRLFDLHTKSSTLAGLGMTGNALEAYVRAVRAPYGFVVVTGPTGSGKTTTLYAALADLNSSTKNICSVEDPIEMKVAGVAQVQVNAKAGVTFPSALRAFMRQDPNVLMVGEMRDFETAAVGIAAALTGQLVLTTLHSNDAPRTIERLVELGVDRHAIASALSIVLGQRLLRRLCEHCRKPAPTPEVVAMRRVGQHVRTFSATGCEVCAGTGYVGRIGVFEVLVINDAMRDAIATGASSVQIAALGRECGYRPMFEDGLRVVAEGRTTLDELHRVVAWDS